MSSWRKLLKKSTSVNFILKTTAKWWGGGGGGETRETCNGNKRSLLLESSTAHKVNTRTKIQVFGEMAKTVRQLGCAESVTVSFYPAACCTGAMRVCRAYHQRCLWPTWMAATPTRWWWPASVCGNPPTWLWTPTVRFSTSPILTTTRFARALSCLACSLRREFCKSSEPHLTQLHSAVFSGKYFGFVIHGISSKKFLKGLVFNRGGLVWGRISS